MARIGVEHSPLRDFCYPTKSFQTSCFKLPPTPHNVNFELDPDYVKLLPKFTGVEDPYLFIREFEEVCSLMQNSQVPLDGIRLRLIPFALKDDAKRWMYTLSVNSIATWDCFLLKFLNRFFPPYKTIRLRKEINLFTQLEHESFGEYMNRFKDLLFKCPHHGLEKWQLCQIVYEGMDHSTRMMVESMCGGKFLDQNEYDAWNFLEDLADRTMYWETIRETTSLGSTPQIGMCSILASPVLDARFAVRDQPRPNSFNQHSTSLPVIYPGPSSLYSSAPLGHPDKPKELDYCELEDSLTETSSSEPNPIPLEDEVCDDNDIDGVEAAISIGVEEQVDYFSNPPLLSILDQSEEPKEPLQFNDFCIQSNYEPTLKNMDPEMVELEIEVFPRSPIIDPYTNFTQNLKERIYFRWFCRWLIGCTYISYIRCLLMWFFEWFFRWFIRWRPLCGDARRN